MRSHAHTILCLAATSLNVRCFPQPVAHMVSVEADNIRLRDALEATRSLFLRELPAHVCAGPLPVGCVTFVDLPLKDLDVDSPSIKHFLDVVRNIPEKDIDVDQLKAIFRDQAWSELPAVFNPKGNPDIRILTQYFLLPQVDGSVCLLKHMYVPDDKVTGIYAETLLHGTGHEIAWGAGNKKMIRKAFQWMLEQLGGTQFRYFTLTPERRRAAPPTVTPDDEGWSFLRFTAMSTLRVVQSRGGARNSYRNRLIPWLQTQLSRNSPSALTSWNCLFPIYVTMPCGFWVSRAKGRLLLAALSP